LYQSGGGKGGLNLLIERNNPLGKEKKKKARDSWSSRKGRKGGEKGERGGGDSGGTFPASVHRETPLGGEKSCGAVFEEKKTEYFSFGEKKRVVFFRSRLRR